ncbi:uncharacterized protein LOC125680236 isoform X2 [Ostrea edulis]|uniref:uncharacterized protein LOC125680236 isoform X2 n=1 Tax=Ostrea edulis TaxID=37623 RepID=UPI0024AF50E0|nr:uncharacterized protein LOC125680236 isoform X2 [Ostrea edulis]
MLCLLSMAFMCFYQVQGLSRFCEHNHQNFTECDVMFYTNWKICTGGHGLRPTACTVGYEKRLKAICCPMQSKNEAIAQTTANCKANCNLTDDDFEEIRPLTTTVPPSTSTTRQKTSTTSPPSTSTTGQRISTSSPKSTTNAVSSPVVPGKTLHSVGNGTKVIDDDSGLSIEQIAGIAAAGAVALIGLCSLFLCLLCKRLKRKEEVEPEQNANDVTTSSKKSKTDIDASTKA